MDIVGIDIGKAKFDVALLMGDRLKQAVFSNTETGFKQLLVWIDRHRSKPNSELHACMEATGNWGLDLGDFLYGQGVQVSIVNPARIKAYGQSELARNKTDKLDAALIARFCRAHRPAAWSPPAAHLRELRELVRRCDALKIMRVQELNRQQAGLASTAVGASISAHVDWLSQEIEAVTASIRALVTADPELSRNLKLLLSIPGIGEISATILLAELPNIAEFTPKGLAAFTGLSPQEHSSGSSVRKSPRVSRIGTSRLRSALYMCALTAKRCNPAMTAFVARLTLVGKPAKVILIAVARKLLVLAHAVIRTQTPFALQD